MYIETEKTPNPNTLKFIPDQRLMESKTPYDFVSVESAECSPLAQLLFSVEGVESLMLGEDFLSVTRKEGYDWQALSPMIIDCMMQYLLSGKPVLVALEAEEEEKEAPDFSSQYDEETLGVVTQIVELIETRVRPAVAADGGDIVFDRFEPESGIVYLHMRGACAGCPSSVYTLKSGIENLLQHFVPEVSSVEAVS